MAKNVWKQRYKELLKENKEQEKIAVECWQEIEQSSRRFDRLYDKIMRGLRS
ncbi:hypothetical protein HY485_00790 [Candidatus Woesearchaeota archaeon]|nr:hypothetical protein [Candidatus Woesearchaeota archaeon]